MVSLISAIRKLRLPIAHLLSACIAAALLEVMKPSPPQPVAGAETYTVAGPSTGNLRIFQMLFRDSVPSDSETVTWHFAVRAIDDAGTRRRMEGKYD